MSFCVNGAESIKMNTKEEADRFAELLNQYNGNLDAAYEIYNREKLGEIISFDTSLFDRDPQLIESTQANFKLLEDKDLDRLSGIVKGQIEALNKRLKDLKKSANNLKDTAKQDRDATVEKLDNLLTGIEDLEVRDQFISIVDYSLKYLKRSEDWLNSKDKGFDPAKESHRDTILALWKQLDTYAGLNVPEYANKHSQLNDKINEVNRLYRDVKSSVESKFMDTIVDIIQSNTTNDKFATREDIEAYLRESNDIDGLQKWFIDLSSSSDTLLATIDKIYHYKRQEIHDINKVAHVKINEAGKALLKAGIKDQEWMSEKDSNGNKTGNIVQKISGDYNKELSRLYSLMDALEVGIDGKKKRREYIQGNMLTEEEKQHNLKLNNDKRQLASFLRAEYWDKESGQLLDGENKKYTDEFKDIRDAHEEYVSGGWVKSDNISDDTYEKYLNKYYGPLVTAYRLVKVDGEFTGEVEDYQTRFVKEQYTEVTDKWGSEDYKKIQANPAQKEFYDFYRTQFQEILDKMPADIAKRMQDRVLRIKSEFYTQLLNKKTPIIKKILQKIKGLLLPEIVTSGRQLDEQGFPINEPGIFYMGDLRNEDRIATLKAEIDSLKNTTDKKKLDRLKNSLLIEQNKPVANELEYDLVESLKAGIDMANAYDIMKQVESTFQIAQEVIRGKNFYEMKNGEPIMSDGKIQLKKGKSNVEDRLGSWMRMVFYNNSQVNDSRTAQLALLLKKYTSAVSVGGLAIFPAFNNIVTAEMSNIIDGAGGRFYKNKNYLRASKMIAKHLANPKWASHLFKPVGKYEEEKPYDLFSALVAHYNFLEENDDRGAGVKQKQTVGQYIKSGNVLYALTEGGEYQAQTRTAIAYLDNKLVDIAEDFEYSDFEGNIKTTEGKKIYLLDAYIFDEATQQLTLRPGVVFDAKAKRQTTGEIKNMNKNIHGNHSSVDKVPMQENWYGELAFQFKRWMPNGIRNRFARSYYDESLGMEMEGRYRAIKSMYDNLEGLSLQHTKEAWNKLSNLEQANMRKNAAEAIMFASALALYIIFDAIREGIPPDDEYTRMALNFLKKQADKSGDELAFFTSPIQWYQQTKSPVAGLRTFGEVAEFISAVSGVPYYSIQGKTDKLRYEKGVNKGDLKVVKEGRDLLPIFKQIGQFKQLDITGDFFIR